MNSWSTYTDFRFRSIIQPIGRSHHVTMVRIAMVEW